VESDGRLTIVSKKKKKKNPPFKSKGGAVRYLEAEEVLPRAHMKKWVARMLHELNDMVGTEGAAVLHTVQQLRVVDEDGELGASPVLPAKFLKYKKPQFY
jgi:hypothetical protein